MKADKPKLPNKISTLLLTINLKIYIMTRISLVFEKNYNEDKRCIFIEIIDLPN